MEKLWFSITIEYIIIFSLRLNKTHVELHLDIFTGNNAFTEVHFSRERHFGILNYFNALEIRMKKICTKIIIIISKKKVKFKTNTIFMDSKVTESIS